MTTTNFQTTTIGCSTLAALASMAASTLKVVTALNSSVTMAAALTVAGATGAVATYMADSQHSSPYAHPYYSRYTADNDTALVNTNINAILYHNANSSSNIFDNTSTLNTPHSNYNTSLHLLAPALNMTHSHNAGSLHNVNSTFNVDSGREISHNNTLVDGLVVDHLPLQLITSTASSKVNLDIEIDIQLLTSDYEGSTSKEINTHIHYQQPGQQRLVGQQEVEHEQE